MGLDSDKGSPKRTGEECPSWKFATSDRTPKIACTILYRWGEESYHCDDY
jgi:hypothetical protein